MAASGARKRFISGGRNTVRPTQVFGEALGAFEPRRRSCRTERLDAGGLKVVDGAGAKGTFGPYDDKIDAVRAAERDRGNMVGRIYRDTLNLARDASIAGRTV